jgi:hypothetical protein
MKAREYMSRSKNSVVDDTIGLNVCRIVLEIGADSGVSIAK